RSLLGVRAPHARDPRAVTNAVVARAFRNTADLAVAMGDEPQRPRRARGDSIDSGSIHVVTSTIRPRRAPLYFVSRRPSPRPPYPGPLHAPIPPGPLARSPPAKYACESVGLAACYVAARSDSR